MSLFKCLIFAKNNLLIVYIICIGVGMGWGVVVFVWGAGWGRGGDNPHKGPFTTPNAILIPFEDFV